MPNLNPQIPLDRLVLHTVHTDEGATELYFGRANDDTEIDWEGTLLFDRDGGFTHKLWNDDDVPLVTHIQGPRVRVSCSEDQPPFYERDAPEMVLFDSAKVTWPVLDELKALKAEIKAALEGDSNDAEHDALASVAQHLGVTYELES